MFRTTILTAAALLTATSAHAAYVHVDVLPDVDASFSRDTSNYVYLEGETAAQSTSNSDTFTSVLDAGRTFFRTNANPSDFWGAGVVYDGARYANRGGNTSFSNINTYWEDLDTGLAGGVYDIFIRAYSAPEGTQSFAFFAGSDRASVDSTSELGSITTVAGDVAHWYRIGSVSLASGTDTFRLKIDSAESTIRFDTVLLAEASVPEPASLSLIAVGTLLVFRRRAR